jgi:peptide/nickel transport system ATP-binding protein
MRRDPTPTARLLDVKDLVVEFPLKRRRKVQAVSGISFHVVRGETLGLVGESGCGKSTLARALVRLQKPTAGEIVFEGERLHRRGGRRRRNRRPAVQMVFQDAEASLNPGRSVGRSIAEPLRVMGGLDRRSRLETARQWLRDVGLDPEKDFHKRPFELSGGQCQRISIARALITRPKLLVCDEPVSSLDVSVQAQILNLLSQMKEHYELTLLFISHDMAVVKQVCDRVAVMYLGRFCEVAGTEALYRAPFHPYTAALLAAHPEPAPGRIPKGVDFKTVEMPSPVSPPSGCRYHTRCPSAQQRCIHTKPKLRQIAAGRRVACHFPL